MTDWEEQTDTCPDHGEQPVRRTYATPGSDPYGVNVLACRCHVACFGPGDPNVVLHRDAR